MKAAFCTDWYDGPVEGLPICEGPSYYLFERKCEHWPPKMWSFVYELHAVPPKVAENSLSVVSRFFEPKWPFWSPIWTFEREEDRQTASAAVD